MAYKYLAVFEYDAADYREARKTAEGIADSNEMIITAVLNEHDLDTDNYGTPIIYIRRSVEA